MSPKKDRRRICVELRAGPAPRLREMVKLRHAGKTYWVLGGMNGNVAGVNFTDSVAI